MARRSILLTMLAFVVAVAVSVEVPVSFVSSHSPHAYLIKAEVEPNAEFKVFSKKLRPSGSHWTTASSLGQKLVFTPSLNSQSLLFNELHEGKHHIAYYGKVSTQNKYLQNRHFHPVNVEFQGENFSFLLPMFSQDLSALRTDRLYRCSNTLLSVDWKHGNSYIVVLSKHDSWRIQESIDNGFVNEERGVHYAKLIDQGHTHPIRVEIGSNKHCLISQKTQPAVIQVDATREFYDLDSILDLVGASVPVLNDLREEQL